MAITTSGQIKLSDIFKDQNETTDNPTAGSNQSLDSFSDSYASAAQVGQGISNNTGSTTAIRTEFSAETDRISHFYGASFPGGFASSLNSDGTGTMELYIGSFNNPTNLITNKDTALVGTETLVIRTYNDVLDGNGGPTDNATATIVQNDGSALTGTNSNQTGTGDEELFAADDGHFEITLSSVNLDDTFDNSTLKVKVEDTNESFDSNFSDSFTYYEKLAGGTISLSASPTSVTDSDDACTVTMIGNSSAGTILNVANTTVSAVTSGDGGTIGGSVIEADNTAQITVSNTPGVIQLTTDLRGNPTTDNSSRNRLTNITNTISIPYTRQITGVQSQGINSYLTGTSVTMQATSKGVNGVDMKLGYGTSNSNSTFTDSQNKSISDSRYVADTQTQAFTINHSSPNSSTSTEAYYSKAEYTSGTATTTAGSQFLIYPNLVYSTTGNKTVNVNGSAQTFAASLTSGVGAAMTISSNFNGDTASGFGPTLSLTPSTNNGVFTITYTGTATQNSNNVQTDTLTVRPTISLSADTSAVYSMPETGDQPTGTYAQNVTLTTSEVGANGTSQYNWTFPHALSGWQIVSGGGSSDDSVTGNFSSGLRGSEEGDGDEDISITLTKNGVTSTSDTETISITELDNQELSNFVLNSSTTVRRGDSNGIQFGFKYKNIETVDISFPLVSAGNSSANSLQANLNVNGDSSPNTLLIHSTITKNVPEFARTTTGLYRVNVRDDADTSPNVYSPSITVKDKAPTTPGSFTTTAGGYSGDQAITWGASDYAARYKIYRSTTSGGSYSLFDTTATADNPTESTTITADATDTQNHYYKVLAENDNSYVDNNGGASTSDEQSSYNSPVQYIVYPVGDNTKNVISSATTLLRTAFNNSTTTTLTFNDPTNPTDAESIASYAYSITTNPGSATLSDESTKNATFNAGSSDSSTGNATVRLTTTLNGGNDPDTTCISSKNLFVYHYPKVTNLTITNGTIQKGVTTLTHSQMTYQGYRKAAATALTMNMKVVNDSGQIVNDNGEITSINDFDDAHLSQQTTLDLNESLGPLVGPNVTTTCRLQVNFNNNNTSSDPDPGWETVHTFSVSVDVVLKLYQAKTSTNSTTFDTDSGNHSTPEDAYNDTSGGTTSLYEFAVYPSVAGQISVGDTIYSEQADGGYSAMNGNNKYYSIYLLDGSSTNVASDVILLGTDGVVDVVYDPDNVPPNDPTGGSSSTSTTGTVTAMDTPSNFTWGYAAGQTINLTRSTTHTITYSWNDNSSIEDSYQVSYKGGAYQTADSSTSHTETETTTGTYSLVVKAVNGTGESNTITINETVSTANETLYIQTVRFESYLISSMPTPIYGWQEVGTKQIGATQGTSFTLGGCDVPAPIAGKTYNTASTPTGLNLYHYKVRVRAGSYSGTIRYTSGAFNVSMNTNLVILDSGGAAGAYIPDVQDFSDSEAYWYGNESNGVEDFADNLGEWTSTDVVHTHIKVNDNINYLISGSTSDTLKVNFNAPSYTLSGNTLYYYQQQTTNSTISGINPSSWDSVAAHASTFTNIYSNGPNEFNNTNDKMFLVMKLRNSAIAESPEDQDWVLSVKAPGYTTKTYTLTLEMDENASGSGTCFIVGTQVMLSNGTWKNIEDITFEDSIKSIALPNAINSDDFEIYGGWEETSLEGMTEEVSEPVFISRDTFYDYYKLTLEDDSEIKVTWEHPFVIFRNDVYKWSKAEDLVIGDKLVTKDDTKVTIELIEEIVQDDEFVTLDIEDVDTYLVKAGENAFIVHNPDKGGGS